MILLEWKPSENLCFLWLKLCIVNFKVNITNFEVNITKNTYLFHKLYCFLQMNCQFRSLIWTLKTSPTTKM